MNNNWVYIIAMINKFILNIFLLTSLSTSLLSCSGYRTPNRTNPLEMYGIRSLAIPMFVNASTLPNVAGPMTKEVKSLMMNFVDLKVRTSFDVYSDAVLIGIVSSRIHRKDSVTNTNTQFTTGGLKTSIGSRNQFYIPSQSLVTLSLRLILIKRPTKREIRLMKSSLNKFLRAHPKNKILFNETISLSAVYSRVIADNLTADSGGVVNFTKNKQAQENTIIQLSQSAALNFKDVILNAF
jgi:hypothetical protein